MHLLLLAGSSSFSPPYWVCSTYGRLLDTHPAFRSAFDHLFARFIVHTKRRVAADRYFQLDASYAHPIPTAPTTSPTRYTSHPLNSTPHALAPGACHQRHHTLPNGARHGPLG
ncbi:MAG: hypothetical protein P8104_12520 [Gammaproteobacteria bacterium]